MRSTARWCVTLSCVCVLVSCVRVRPGAPVEEPSSQTDADPWQDARQRGVDFRAVGQEPGWWLEIEEGGEIRFVYDYGDRTLAVKTRPPIVLDDLTTYEARDGARWITVLIRPLPCNDAMSGAAYPMTVTVTVEEGQYRGCGRALTATP